MIEFRPISPALLTSEEACQFLRLDEGREMGAALKALSRLVDKGVLRPCLVGNHRRYSIRELDRFIDDQTGGYGELTQ